MPSAEAGWKWNTTCNNDWEWYKSLLVEFNRRLMSYGNVDGATLFNIGWWKYFEFDQREVAELAAALT